MEYKPSFETPCTLCEDMWVLQKLVVGKAQLWSYYGINNVESLMF